MKILYAVQATGNGHITRARIMAEAFKQLNIEVDWIFSGRPKEELFDMQPFADYKAFSGLTFAIKNGSIQYVKTAFKNNLFKFIRDLFRVDFDGYDLVINDFEPITAWAAKIKGIKTTGLSHQMSFQKEIPTAGGNFIARFVLKHFAPVSRAVGLHWDDFGQNLLPPVIEAATRPSQLHNKQILVYYPFVDSQQLIEWFAPFEQFNFHIFHGKKIESGHQHINFYPFSRSHFQEKQLLCCGVITAGGFELPSEAIDLGHKLLIIPLQNQMEQQSNALALKEINRATIDTQFNHRTLEQWLQQPAHPPEHYPNVAYEVAKWLVNSENESLASLSKRLWSATRNQQSDRDNSAKNIIAFANS